MSIYNGLKYTTRAVVETAILLPVDILRDTGGAIADTAKGAVSALVEKAIDNKIHCFKRFGSIRTKLSRAYNELGE